MQVLKFVLFSNPNDTIGSIMSISNSPGFSFNPATMQAGTTYYTATVAGENLNGNVNLNGDCLDSPSGIQLIQATSLTVANCTCN